MADRLFAGERRLLSHSDRDALFATDFAAAHDYT